MKNLLLLVVSVLVSFGVFEIVSRAFVDVPSPYSREDGRLAFDSRSFWLNLPDSDQVFDNRVDFRNARLRTDAAGLRRVSCQGDSRSDAPRVFVIGDSQTFGFGLADDETWISIMQCALRDAGSLLRFVNLGVPGTNLDQYFLRLGLILDQIDKEDTVLLALTWNDVHTPAPLLDPQQISTACPNPGRLIPGENGLAACFDAEKPHYYGEAESFRRTLYDATGVFIPDFSSPKAFVRTVTYTSAVAHIFLPMLEALYLTHRRKNTLEILEPNAVDSNIALLRVFDAVVREKTPNMAYVLVPSRISYVDSIYAVYSRGGTVFPQQDFLAHMLDPFCSSPNIQCVSLFEPLKTDTRGVNDFVFDGHLNPDGAAKVAEYLRTRLFAD